MDEADNLTGRTLTLLAPLMAHILTRVGGVRVSHGAPTTAAWEAPLPLNQDAFDDANWLWTVLTETVVRVATRDGSTAPDISRSVWRNQHGRTVGLPDRIDVTGGYDATKRLSDWLKYNADGNELAWLTEAAREMSPRHPLKDRPHASKEAVCEDDGGTLIVKPARWFGDEQIAVCQQCGRVYDERAIHQTAVRYAAVQAAERVHKRAARAAAHLAAKYGSVQ